MNRFLFPIFTFILAVIWLGFAANRIAEDNQVPNIPYLCNYIIRPESDCHVEIIEIVNGTIHVLDQCPKCYLKVGIEQCYLKNGCPYKKSDLAQAFIILPIFLILVSVGSMIAIYRQKDNPPQQLP